MAREPSIYDKGLGRSNSKVVSWNDVYKLEINL